MTNTLVLINKLDIKKPISISKPKRLKLRKERRKEQRDRLKHIKSIKK